MKLTEAIQKIRPQFSGSLELEAPLSRYSYYQIGGAAEVLATPKTIEDLKLLSTVIQETGSPFFILGRGSNLLFPDQGLRGMVIQMKHLFTEITLENLTLIKVGASVGGSTLLRMAQEKGWGGLAHLTGIPGSIGGMVAMNAGTHIGEVSNCCERVDCFSLTTGEQRSHLVTSESFSYRHNHFLSASDLVTFAYLKFHAESPIEVKQEVEFLYQRRKQTQPVDYRSCGSVFMNPKEVPLHAWQVIDQLKLRGHISGKAQISEKHSNFIINLGGATAEDVKRLIDLVKTRAKLELGIELQEEVKIL